MTKRQSSKAVSQPGSESRRAREVSRPPSWLEPLRLRHPAYRRMRKALIQEIAPRDPIEWILAEEYVFSQYQVMLFGGWQPALLQFSVAQGLRRAVKERLRAGNKDGEEELEWKAARVERDMRPYIDPTALQAETFLARRTDLDSVHRRQVSAQIRRDAALRQIDQRRSRKEEQMAQTSRRLVAKSKNGGSSAPEVAIPKQDESSPTALRNGH